MTTKFTKKPDAVVHAIPLRLKPKASPLQAQNLKFYTLKSQNGIFYLTDSAGEIAAQNAESAEFQFVVLKHQTEHGDYLELRISQGNHWYIAGGDALDENNMAVMAAGDLHLSFGKIKKITDQSGGFYIPNTEPDASQKKLSALHAMKAVGLPLDRFQPFVQDDKALMFSTALQFQKLVASTCSRETLAEGQKGEPKSTKSTTLTCA